MKDLESRLYGLHSVYKEIDPVPQSKDHADAPAEDEEAKTGESGATEQMLELQIDSTKAKSELVRIPFVWIHDVMPGSPAEQDGFHIGDAICDFGGVTAEAGEEGLNKVVDTIKQNPDRPITVEVLRKNLVMSRVDPITINYTPREWSGRGVLGCVLKMVPY